MHVLNSSTYNINGFKVKLPKKHMLPVFQKKFPLYHRFLPFFIKNYQQTGTIINVGANCGDTLFSMHTKENHYVCIEGSKFFYDYLTHNVSQYNLKNVESICALVGNNVETSGTLSKGETTKLVVNLDGDDGIQYQRLDDICSDIKDLILLKSDVDGFDYDVINSGLKLIEKFKPILYFEAQFNVEDDMCKYQDLIKTLNNKDFTYMVLFDNFGEVFYRGTIDHSLLNNFFDYVFYQNFGKAARTIYYFDILICDHHKINEVSSIIDQYIKSYKK